MCFSIKVEYYWAHVADVGVFRSIRHSLVPVSPVVKGHTGKIKHWFLLVFVFTQLLLAFSGLPLFTHHPPLSAAHRVHITSHNSRTPYCCSDEVSEGRGYSWRRMKCVKWSECVCFSESRSNWPVPDDKEPRRLSQHCRCPGAWVQEWFVQLSHLLIPLSVCFFNFLFKADWNWFVFYMCTL